MEQQEKRFYVLSTEKLQKSLLVLGIPTMVGMLVSALYGIVDAFFIGKLGTLNMAAVTVVYPLTMVGTGIGLLFGSGAGSYLARLLGAGEYEKVSRCVTTVIFTGTTVGIVVIGSMIAFFEPLMRLLGATDAIMPLVKEYGILFIAGLAFNIFNVMVNNMIVAEGASGYSMLAMLCGSICNIILCPALIYGAHMGIRGAAVATLVSRILSFGCYLRYICHGKSYLKISLKLYRPEKQLFKEVFKVGIPLLLFQLLATLIMSVTNVAAKAYGSDAIAAVGIVNRILSLESMALFGFLKGYQPLVGYNYGAGNMERTKEATKIALIWSCIYCIGFGVICILFADPIISAFNKSSLEVLQIGIKALIINSISYMTLGVQIVFGTYFLAIGRAKEGGILSICRQGIFYFPFIFILPHFMGLTGVISAQLAADICSFSLTLFMVYYGAKKKHLFG